MSQLRHCYEILYSNAARRVGPRQATLEWDSDAVNQLSSLYSTAISDGGTNIATIKTELETWFAADQSASSPPWASL